MAKLSDPYVAFITEGDMIHGYFMSRSKSKIDHALMEITACLRKTTAVSKRISLTSPCIVDSKDIKNVDHTLLNVGKVLKGLDLIYMPTNVISEGMLFRAINYTGKKRSNAAEELKQKYDTYEYNLLLKSALICDLSLIVSVLVKGIPQG
jgi:hypothetical protein